MTHVFSFFFFSYLSPFFFLLFFSLSFLCFLARNARQTMPTTRRRPRSKKDQQAPKMLASNNSPTKPWFVWPQIVMSLNSVAEIASSSMLRIPFLSLRPTKKTIVAGGQGDGAVPQGAPGQAERAPGRCRVHGNQSLSARR